MNNYIYFIGNNKYLICDVDFCLKSERTIDISFYELANNERLLNLLALYYIQGNYGVKYTYESRAKWFSGYLSAFSQSNKEKFYEKLLTNPTIRILIEDKELLEKIQNIK